MKKWIYLHLGPRTPYLSTFGLEFEYDIVILNQLPQIFLIVKFREKTKTLKFGAENASFEYFWVRISKNYCHIWNQLPRIYLIAKLLRKTKIPKFGTKNALFGCFWAIILKNYCHIWNQHPQICLTAKFYEKTKIPKFGTKNVYFSIFDQKCLIWVFLGMHFKKTIVISKISILKFVYSQNFTKKQKCLIYVFLGWNLKAILSYLKSAFSNLSNCNISQKKKQKCLNFGSKMPYLGIFCLEF